MVDGAPGTTVTAPAIRSSRKLLTSPRVRSWPTTYQRPRHDNTPQGSTVRRSAASACGLRWANYSEVTNHLTIAQSRWRAIENSANNRPGYELTVRLDDGEMRAIVQEADEPFAPGDRVRILSRGGLSRVTH